MLGPDPVYRAMLSVDIEKSAGRGDGAMSATKNVLRTSMRDAFTAAGLSWRDCHQTDLGDGLRWVTGPDVAKSKLVDPFLGALAAGLQAHNRAAPARERIRLRVAFHAGEVFMAEGQVVGRPLEMLARLLEAPPLRSALENAPGSRAVAVGMSEHFYDDTVARDLPGIPADLFRRSKFAVKETDANIWIHVPGYSVAGVPTGATEKKPAPSETAGRWVIRGENVNVAADQARVGQQVGRLDQRGQINEVPTTPADLRLRLADLGRALHELSRAGHLDQELYEAAVRELREADQSLDEPRETRKSRFMLALRRLRGLVDEVADLAARIATIMQAGRGLGG